MYNVSGWRWELEDRKWTRRSACALHPDLVRGNFEVAYDNFEDLIRVEDQQQTGSCVGWSGSSGGETLQYRATGEWTQFSAMYAYYTAQKHSGTFGADQGATISGAIKAYYSTGFCREKLLPFSGQYDPRIPEAAIAEGKQHRLRQHTPLRSVRDVVKYIGSRTGFVFIGIPVYRSFMELAGDGVLDEMRGEEFGLHALLFVQLSKELHENGTPYPEGPNSWGRKWGRGGWWSCRPGLFERLLGDERTECVGISELDPLQSPNTRVDWKKGGVY